MTTFIAKDSGRLAWLMAALGEQQGIVASLMRRLTCFNAPGSMKPSVFRKFIGTLEQVAVEKDRENEIISRIQFVEKQHRLQRACGNLKTASLTPKNGLCEVAEELEQERSNSGWLMVMGLVCLLSRRDLSPRE